MTHGQTPRAVAGLLAAVLLLGAAPAAAAAQDPLGRPARDTVGMDLALDEMQAHLEVLLPAMRRLVLTLQDALPELEQQAPGAAAPDVGALARRAARFTRAYYEALVAEGFSRDEALRIVSGAGPPRR